VITAVILASGFSRRMGREKLDLALGGRTFLQRAIDAATGAQGVDRCLVVVRPEDESKVQGPRLDRQSAPLNVRSGPAGFQAGTLGNAPSIEVVLNPLALEGQSASIRLATGRLIADPDVEAAIFSVVDQPFLTAAVFEALIAAWCATPDAILVSSYAGQRGNPALFPRAYFSELRELTGDVGGREVIRRHPDVVREVAMPDPAAGQDIDTWEEYQRAYEEEARARSRGLRRQGRR
jgi:molybdenum cofactor cytidylyltransferase